MLTLVSFRTSTLLHYFLVVRHQIFFIYIVTCIDICDISSLTHCELDAAFCVHSTAFCLTADAPSSSPILRSSSSHFLKNDLYATLAHAIPLSGRTRTLPYG